MSSTESSGAPAENTATTEQPSASAAATTFGSSRGSGLARGKRPTSGTAQATTAPSGDYKPTAIEVVNAPREYQNPFAPAEPVATETPAPTPVVEPLPVITAPASLPAVAPAKAEASAVRELFPLEEKSADSTPSEDIPAPEADDAAKAELNILPPAEQKTAPAQTWESEGFRPARESRGDRSRREGGDRPAREQANVDTSKFIYIRPGHTPAEMPTGSVEGYRQQRSPERSSAPVAASTPAPAAKKSSGGFLGWLKSLFGGNSEAKPAGQQHGERREGGSRGDNAGGQRGNRRHRGGRGRGQHAGAESHSHGGEHRGGEGHGQGGERREGGNRRRRGGRGRGQGGGGFRGERSGGGDQGGSAAT